MTVESRRVVHANRIVSSALPAVSIAVDPAFTYVGGPSFRLYGIAHAEQHLFVITDEQHTIRRLLWMQFEGFLPDNGRHYRYTVTQTVNLAGVSFIYDTFSAVVEAAIAERPDSDFAAARNFLQEQGYRMPNEVQGQRFVHLIAPDNRNELMIIYAESAKAAENLPAEEAQARAIASFTLHFS